MKKIAIVGLSALLSACVSPDYTTDVTSESYQEDYQSADTSMVQPVVSTTTGPAQGVEEQNVEPTVVAMPTEQTEPAINVQKNTQPKASTVTTIAAPSKKQVASHPRFGYTIQVVAVGSQAKVDRFAKKLPATGEPIWENYKVVNGTKWYTVLYGDYATRVDAERAISQLPADFQALKPFAKSIDKIKNSEFPTLNKLN